MAGRTYRGRTVWMRLRAGMLACGLGMVLLAGLGMVEGRSQERPAPAALIGAARKALSRGDGIDAEMKLRAALDGGAVPRDVAAWMGEAYLAQNNPDKARQWLKDGSFSDESAVSGWRALARLERLDGNLPAAGKAFDRALRITPDDPALWVEIGRLRYAGGQHLLAIAAADHALQLDPQNVRALEFKGQLVRDRFGLIGALAWFEKALLVDKDDVPVLLEYAATLGELGRASETVIVTRRVLELDPGNPRAYYLQAVIAARSGRFTLVRSLLAHTQGKLDYQPAVLQLRGIAELASGNPLTAGEAFEAVLRIKPDSRRTKDLLARAIYLSGEYRYATLRFANDIAKGTASPYMLTVVARSHEALGERQKAGELLDAAAHPGVGMLRLVGTPSRIGALLAEGRMGAAEQAAEAARRDDPGLFDNLALAGDVQLALERPRAAQERYAQAAEIRMPPGLFLRRYEAFVMAGDINGAHGLVNGYLEQNPQNREALRAAAALSIATGDMARAHAILTWLRANGSARDVQLLSDLALVEVGLGDLEAAQQTAQDAYRLQRSSPQATQALGFTLAALGRHPDSARALFDKAEALVGKTPLIAQGRAMLAEVARSGVPKAGT